MFQALVLAFWKFQSLFSVTVFRQVLEAIEVRSMAELRRAHPGRFKHKGRKRRTWHLPFGTVQFPMVKFKDLRSGKVFRPLEAAMELPDRVRWSEEALLPGFRISVLQSFRKSARAVAGISSTGEGPDHRTLHRRFQSFASTHAGVVPDLSHKRGPKPSAFQQADGTKIKLQKRGKNIGQADLRIVVGSRTAKGKLEVLDCAIGDNWDEIAERIRSRFPSPPKVLVTDGEEKIPEALSGPDTVHQRCLVHGRRNLSWNLYQDGFLKPEQAWAKRYFASIKGLQMCQKELDSIDKNDKARIEELLKISEEALEKIKEFLPEKIYPTTQKYILSLVEEGLSYLRELLSTGRKIPLSTNRMENVIGQITLRLKRIGRRWSAKGGLNMLNACLLTALHPDRYAEVESTVRGEHHPSVSIIISNISTAWSS